MFFLDLDEIDEILGSFGQKNSFKQVYQKNNRGHEIVRRSAQNLRGRLLATNRILRKQVEWNDGLIF